MHFGQYQEVGITTISMNWHHVWSSWFIFHYPLQEWLQELLSMSLYQTQIKEDMWVPENSASSIIGNQVLVYNLVRFYNIFNSFYILLSEQYEISKSVYWILSSSMSLFDQVLNIIGIVRSYFSCASATTPHIKWQIYGFGYVNPFFSILSSEVISSVHLFSFRHIQTCMWPDNSCRVYTFFSCMAILHVRCASFYILYLFLFFLWRHVVDRLTWLFLHVNRFIFWFGLKLNHKLGLLACGFRMQYVEMAGIPSS